MNNYERMTKENNLTVNYLCDGNKPECKGSTKCYKNTDDFLCEHTADINHAKNFLKVNEDPMSFEEINKEKFDLVAARTVNLRGQEIPTYHTLWVKEQRIKKDLKILKGLNILLFVLVILNFLMTLMQ